MFISAESCFQLLTPTEMEQFQSNKIFVDFKKGETIIKRGFVASNILYVEKGLAILDIMNDGQSKTIGLIPEKSFIGIICTFASKNLNFSARAIEDTRVQVIDCDFFEQLIKQNGEFAFKMIQHMSQITNTLIHSISRFSHKNIDGALSILLLDLTNIYCKDDFTLPFNRIEMADMLGYSKESVINSLSRMNKEKIIKLSGKKIEILEKQKLEIISING